MVVTSLLLSSLTAEDGGVVTGTPHHVVVSADQRRAYVTFVAPPQVMALNLDPTNLAAAKVAKIISVGTGVQAVHDPALHKSGKFLYVSNSSAGTLSTINTESLTAVQTVTDAIGTHEVNYNPRNDKVMIGSIAQTQNMVKVYDVNAITGLLSATPSSSTILVDGANSGLRPWECYWMNTVNEAYCSVTVANTSAEVWHVIPGGATTRALALADVTKSPNDSITDATDSKLFVAVGDGVNIYDITGAKKTAPTLIGTVTAGVGSGTHGLALGPNNKSVYVGNKTGNSVSRIDIATNAIIATYTGLSLPEGIQAFDATVAAKQQTVYFVNTPTDGGYSLGVSTNDSAPTAISLPALGFAGIAHHTQTTSTQSRAYVTFFSPSRVGVISLGPTPTKVAEVALDSVGSSIAHDLAVTSDNRWVFLSVTSTSKLFRLDTSTNVAVEVDTGTTLDGGVVNTDLIQPHEVAYDPRLNQLMIGSLSSAQPKILVYSINLATGALTYQSTKTVSLIDGANLGSRGWECRWLHTREEGYCSATHKDPLVVPPTPFNTVWYVKPGAVAGSAKLAIDVNAIGLPNDLITNLDDTKLFLAVNDQVAIYDISTTPGTPVAITSLTVGAGAHGLELSPDGTSLYVTSKSASGGAGALLRIDVKTNTIVSTQTGGTISVPEGLQVH